MASGGDHQRLQLNFDGRYFIAACGCGWISDRVSSAGLAGATWDLHRDEVQSEWREVRR